MSRLQDYFYSLLIIAMTIVTVFGQESINVGVGMNVGMHAGIAVLMSFSILASCAIGVNVLTKFCAKRIIQ